MASVSASKAVSKSPVSVLGADDFVFLSEWDKWDSPAAVLQVFDGHYDSR